MNIRMNIIIAHIRLMRPANIVTAIADILAGFAVSGAALQLFSSEIYGSTSLLNSVLWLILSTIGLYGGGIVFNDVFDAKLDRKERPERPIPSGKASVVSAGILGIILLAIGITAAWQVSTLSGIIALAVAALAVLYDAWGKYQLIFGPVNMGLCRGGNLLLGVSAIPAAVQDLWFLALIPIIYIAAITMISRGEVHGGNRKALAGGIIMYGIIILVLIILSFLSDIVWWQVLPFVLLFSFLIFPPLIKALKKQEPQLIGKAVKAGVLSLIVLNATIASAFAGWVFGVIVLLLLPVSLVIAKKFSVT
jgi:4-hydroxybenzoate polyprenyltransferase